MSVPAQPDERPPWAAALWIALGTIALFHATVWLVRPAYWWTPVWDEGFYTNIARSGYAVNGNDWLVESNTAFFPGLPLLQRAIFAATGVAPEWQRPWLAAVCFSIAMPLLAIAMHDIAPAPRRVQRALALFAVWPGSSYFLSGYAESLYLPLLAAFFVALGRRRFGWAAAAAAAALLVRQPAVVLVPTLAVAMFVDMAARRDGAAWWRRGAELLWHMALAVSGLLLAMALQWWQVGDPLAFLRAYSAWDLTLVHDQRHWTLENVAEAVRVFGADYWSVALAAVLCVATPAVLIVQRTKIPPAMLLFAVLAWSFFLSQNTMSMPFQNHLRWLAALFMVPYGVVLCCERVPAGTWLYRFALGAGMLVYVYLVQRFVQQRWVS